MTTDEQMFLAAIAASRWDEGLRKVYADWLDEQGRPEEAAYQRRWTRAVGEAEDWLRAFADHVDAPYDEVVAAGRRVARSGAQETIGSDMLGFEADNFFDSDAKIDAFWDALQLVADITVDEEVRADRPFVCSCA